MKYIGAISVLFVALFTFLPAVAQDSVVKECTPFAEKDVPDEAKPEWEFYTATKTIIEDNGGTKIVVGISRYYQNREKLGLKLGVHEYFGEVAMKAWACRSSGEDPVTKDTADHMVAIFKDGKWYVANVQHPEQVLLRNAEGKIDGTSLSILDKDGKIIIERTILRPATP